jgi:hypothetical protein
MKFAKYTFLIAGIYGLLVSIPQFFLEEKTGRDYPPAINHPEYYYGFFCVVVAWQIAFLIISRNPVRFRPLMPAAMIEKFGFALAVAVLFALNRVPVIMVGLAGIDLILGVLFVVSFLKTAKE